MSSSSLWLRHTDKAPADAYHRYLVAQRALINGDVSMLPVEKRDQALAAIRAKNEHILKLREVGADNVQDDKFLTSFSVQYANDEYIGLMLMPVAPVPNIEGSYVKYDESARMGVVDDTIAGRDGANEIDDGKRSKLPYACEEHSLKNLLNWKTAQNQTAPLNEMLDLTLALSDQIALNRESRIATVVTDSAQYDSSNVIAVAANDQFDSSGGGDPLGVMLSMNSKLWMGRGPARTYAWFSQEVYNVIAKHPQILDVAKYTQGGLVRPQSLAEYFGWDGVLIGKARYRTSNKGQTNAYSRFWGNNMGLVRTAITPSVRQAAFGYTLRWNGERTRLWWDNKAFTDGAYVVQSSNDESYKVVANKAAVLCTTPIAPF